MNSSVDSNNENNDSKSKKDNNIEEDIKEIEERNSNEEAKQDLDNNAKNEERNHPKIKFETPQSFAKNIEDETRKFSQFTKNLQINTVNPATKLLEKRRHLYEVQEAFDVEKDNFKKKEEEFKKRENELRDKDYEIQASLIKFSKYLNDIQAKTQRATKRIQEEKKVN